MKYGTLEEIESAKAMITCPGATLLETMNYEGLEVHELAQQIGQSVKTVNEIISGSFSINEDTAKLLEDGTGISAQFWMNLEHHYRSELTAIYESELHVKSQKQ